MKSITLIPGSPKAKHLRLGLIIVEWEKNALRASILFDVTRDREDTKAGGMVIFAHNSATLCKELQDLSLIYPPKQELIVHIPDVDEGRLSSEMVADLV